MQIGISSLLASVPELMNIIVAALFAMAVWTILGLQLYQSRCSAGGVLDIVLRETFTRPLLIKRPASALSLLPADVMHNNCFVMGPNGQPLPYPPTPDSNSTDYTPEDNKGQMCSAMDVWAGAQCALCRCCCPAQHLG